MAVKVTPVITHRCDLEFRSGSSDKVYHIWIEQVGANHTVKFMYGRRGSTLNSGTKIELTHSVKARDVYLSVIKEKLGKGYKDVTKKKPMGPATTSIAKISGAKVVPIPAPGPSHKSIREAPTVARPKDGAITPMLLNAIKEPEMLKLMKDDKWFFQEKHDGRRMIISKNSKGLVLAWNRKGQLIEAPEEYFAACCKFGDYQFSLDGEACGDKFYAFDIISLQFQDQTKLPLEERLQNLGMLLRSVEQDTIVMVYTAESHVQKTSLVRAIKEGNREGVAIKDRTKPYTSGRPNSGGPALKCKFIDSVTCVVTLVNDKRSVQIGLAHNPSAMKAICFVGNVTIPINFDMPKEGDIVEVEYLYALTGGSLYQPVYKGPRDDVPIDTIQDLKIKPTTTTKEE